MCSWAPWGWTPTCVHEIPWGWTLACVHDSMGWTQTCFHDPIGWTPTCVHDHWGWNPSYVFIIPLWANPHLFWSHEVESPRVHDSPASEYPHICVHDPSGGEPPRKCVHDPPLGLNPRLRKVALAFIKRKNKVIQISQQFLFTSLCFQVSQSVH